MTCESARLTLLHKINKLTSSFPGFQFPLTPFPPFYPTQLPATNGNDYVSSVSQLQSTFFHPLRHNHIPATTITTQITVVPSYSSLCLASAICIQSELSNYKPGNFIPQLKTHEFIHTVLGWSLDTKALWSDPCMSLWSHPSSVSILYSCSPKLLQTVIRGH